MPCALLSSRQQPGGPPDWHPASKAVKQVCSRAREICADKGVDIARLAIRTSIEDKSLPTTLVSAAKLKYMEQNIKCALEPLSTAERYEQCPHREGLTMLVMSS